MNPFLSVVVVTFVQVILCLIAAWIGWHSTDLLNYGDWFTVCFVGSVVVRGAIWLEELANDLTK